MNGKFLNLVYIIDESGSMQGTESDVIGGFNKYLEMQRFEKAGKVTVSLYKFNDVITRVFANKPIQEVVNLTQEDYKPGSFTALYDAIGLAISKTDMHLSTLSDNEKPDKTLVVIITDGQENASREFSSLAVRSLIDTHKNLLHWDFIFLGAGLDNFTDADTLGLKQKASFSKKNILKSFDKISDSNVNYRMKQDEKNDYDVETLLSELNKGEEN